MSKILLLNSLVKNFAQENQCKNDVHVSMLFFSVNKHCFLWT